MFRLIHRRRLHLLSFAFCLSRNDDLLDKRNIHTRQHDENLFLIPKIDHYTCYHDPTIRAMKTWNQLTVETRSLQTKNKFIARLKLEIDNPFQKILN